MTRKHHRRPSRLPVRVVEHPSGGRALEVAGVVQSLAITPENREDFSTAAAHHATEAGPPLHAGSHSAPQGGYWGLMLPPYCPRRALLLGLGGGTVATLLARRCPACAIVGIERDEEVLAVARAEFGLDALPQLRPVLADAFHWVEAAVVDELGAYDLICLDLFEGGRLTQGALATPFLRQLAALLAPDGLLTANLMITARTPDQLHRLRRVYTIERESRLRGNLVVHARPLQPPA